MKIDLKLAGADAASADFAALRTALMAAQAATPTARVARQTSPWTGDVSAFELFAANAGGETMADRAVRHGNRFTDRLPGAEEA